MKARGFAAAAACVFLLSACKNEEFVQPRASDPDFKSLEQFIYRLAARDPASIRRYLSDTYLAKVNDEQLAQLARQLPPGRLVSTRVVAYRALDPESPDGGGAITFELEFEDGWALVNASFSRGSKGTLVENFQVQPTEESRAASRISLIPGPG